MATVTLLTSAQISALVQRVVPDPVVAEQIEVALSENPALSALNALVSANSLAEIASIINSLSLRPLAQV